MSGEAKTGWGIQLKQGEDPLKLWSTQDLKRIKRKFHYFTEDGALCGLYHKPSVILHSCVLEELKCQRCLVKLNRSLDVRFVMETSKDVFEEIMKNLETYEGLLGQRLPALGAFMQSSNARTKALIAGQLYGLVKVLRRMAELLIRDVEQLEAFLNGVEPVEAVEP